MIKPSDSVWSIEKSLDKRESFRERCILKSRQNHQEIKGRRE
jgi:hypothetical protein